jgi:hypothetical protein
MDCPMEPKHLAVTSTLQTWPDGRSAILTEPSDSFTENTERFPESTDLVLEDPILESNEPNVSFSH